MIAFRKTTACKEKIKNGPKYSLELINNLTFPEISVENEEIDFGRVLVN